MEIGIDQRRADAFPVVRMDMPDAALHGEGFFAHVQGEDDGYFGIGPHIVGEADGGREVDASEGDVVDHARVRGAIKTAHECGGGDPDPGVAPLLFVYRFRLSLLDIVAQYILDERREGPPLHYRNLFQGLAQIFACAEAYRGISHCPPPA